MPAPLGNQNRLEHGCRASYPNAQDAPNRVESGEIETDYRFGIPALPKPLTQAHGLACKFRRDLVNAVRDVHGERAVWIDERIVSKGRLKGTRKPVRRIATAYAKLIQSATLSFRSCYVAGVLSRLVLAKADLEAFGKWQDREQKFADACDRKLESLGVLKLVGHVDQWAAVYQGHGAGAPQPASEAADAKDVISLAK